MSLDEGCRKYRTDSRSTSSTAAVCCSIDSPRSCGRPLTIGRLTKPRQNANVPGLPTQLMQMVEQAMHNERTGVGTQRGGNLVFGEIVQYRPQRQARPVRGRTFRVDRAAGRNHVVGIRLGCIHEICGASFQQNATGGALEPCGDDDVRLGLFDGFQQCGPGFWRSSPEA